MLISYILELLGKIPVVGVLIGILSICLPYLLIAGIVYSCDRLHREGSFHFGDLFAAFNRQTRPLLLLCLLAIGIFFATFVIFGIFLVIIGGTAAATAGLTATIGNPDAAAVLLSLLAASSGMLILIALPILFVVFACSSMMIWFAPALVMMHNIAPFEAIKMSFRACRKNIPTGILYFIVLGILVFISALPVGLGLLITLPMCFISAYTTYRDVFFNADH